MSTTTSLAAILTAGVVAIALVTRWLKPGRKRKLRMTWRIEWDSDDHTHPDE